MSLYMYKYIHMYLHLGTKQHEESFIFTTMFYFKKVTSFGMLSSCSLIFFQVFRCNIRISHLFISMSLLSEYMCVYLLLLLLLLLLLPDENKIKRRERRKGKKGVPIFTHSRLSPTFLLINPLSMFWIQSTFSTHTNMHIIHMYIIHPALIGEIQKKTNK